MSDDERIRRVVEMLEQTSCAAFFAASPSDVLLLTGYWPFTGNSIAVVDTSGTTKLLVPEDESDFAAGEGRTIETYETGSLQSAPSEAEATIASALNRIIDGLRLHGKQVGCATAARIEPAPYAAFNNWNCSLRAVLEAAPEPPLVVASDEAFRRLRAVLTIKERREVAEACNVARDAFEYSAARLRADLTEREAAGLFRDGLTQGNGLRSNGFTYCMSGPNSALAYRSFQYSSTRRLGQSEPVLVHCNSYRNGYWTDITRTYFLGPFDSLARRVYEAILAASERALRVARPGVKASNVDAAAREVLAGRGFAGCMRHGLGHGVGFAAIDAAALPRVHPASPDVLEPGMVFNIEPAVYIEGWGGIRHCDMVAMEESGPTVLTSFHSSLPDLIREEG